MARSRLLSVIVVIVASLGVVTTAAAAQPSGDDPGLTCSPADPPAGGQLNCTAEGLEAASEAAWTASFAGGTEEGGTETADDNGRAEFKVDVPDEPGAYTVTVTGTAADGGAYEESFSGSVKGTGPDDGDGGEGEAGDDGESGAPASDDDSRESQAGGQPKIGLCHATASATNPYVYIEVGAPAATKGGHANHEGDLIDGRDGEFDGPEDCPFEASEAAVACVSTAGLERADDEGNLVLCRAKDLQPSSPVEFDVTFASGGSTAGAGMADGDGVARFEFRAPKGEFTVAVRGIAADATVFDQAAAGVAGERFDDEVAQPAPAPQVEATPVGGVAAGHGGAADRGLPSAAVALILLTVALLATATVPARRRGSGSRR